MNKVKSILSNSDSYAACVMLGQHLYDEVNAYADRHSFARLFNGKPTDA